MTPVAAFYKRFHPRKQNRRARFRRHQDGHFPTFYAAHFKPFLAKHLHYMRLDPVNLPQLLRARELSEQALLAFHDPILAVTMDSRVFFQNQIAQRLLCRVNLRDQLPYLLEQLLKPVLRTGRNHISKIVNAIGLSVNDRETFFLPFILALRDEHGALDGAVVVLHDLTQLRPYLPLKLT